MAKAEMFIRAKGVTFMAKLEAVLAGEFEQILGDLDAVIMKKDLKMALNTVKNWVKFCTDDIMTQRAINISF